MKKLILVSLILAISPMTWAQQWNPTNYLGNIKSQFESKIKNPEKGKSGKFSKGGVVNGGGGDPCEDRIKEIRDDLKLWIANGGAKDLKFSTNLSAEDYSKKMLAEIRLAKIQCVGPGDSDYPVEVQGTAKVCRFDKGYISSKITCDQNKIQNFDESEQYFLIHHEFAGLAGFENPIGDDSTYEISNQITAFLEDQIVKKLVVKSSRSQALSDGYYTDGVNPLCSVRVKTYLESGTVVLSTADSTNGYACNQEKSTEVFKCDKNYLCRDESGDSLKLEGKGRLVVSRGFGGEQTLTFAAAQIPVAYKFSRRDFQGWEFIGFNGNCKSKLGSVRCKDIGLKHVQADQYCKLVTRDSEALALQTCQMKNFTHCEILKSNASPVILEDAGEIDGFVAKKYRTGCWSEVLVQGSK